MEGELGDPLPHEVLAAASEEVLGAVGTVQAEHVGALSVVPGRLATRLEGSENSLHHFVVVQL